uniref:Uncharacterized protein n=1 Tax=Neobodo designis TaxID=312471 RepID=A0A7S1PPB9_NEODS|mmetsp:Transcript_12945/g.40177  ORF Transcript_12945/g.40177 Transcript_12945/m.40177 type:complete len:539 (+) Transcript_12945:56-1672(+)|eukprot:CAMPEP_0174852266 /NCGR_PEP_ID=MMETSP1114-20130205/25274_1 /TAXON_ID=312471 /ORGANISM="Neobodo designis, Strain CCAP 1951/1" /LENGTH=538 /DNA_ID=CAMNT_0016086847 /DNA_START=56 /DNA_END=1672 /DNA_ORIENTATION=-
MVKVLSILFFDHAASKWGRAKPQKSPPTPSPHTFTAAVIQFVEQDDMSDDAASARVKAFSDALKSRLPSVIALNAAPPAFVSAVLGLDWVRHGYAVAEGAPTSTLLWNISLPVQLAEASERPQCTAINLRKFFGADCMIGAAHTQCNMSPEQRAAEAHQLASRGVADGTTILLFNPYNANDSKACAAAAPLLSKVREVGGFSEDVSVPDAGPTVWLRGNLMITGVTPVAIASDAISGALIATMAPRVVPQTTLEDKSATPASVSSTKEASAAAVFPSTPTDGKAALQQQQQSKKRVWSSKHSSAIRIRENTDEVHYDLTPFFPKSEDAIKALCANAFSWPSDYCVLHGRLLAVHGQNADIPAFRQYMQHNAPPPKPDLRGVAGANSLALPREQAEKRRGKDPGNFSPYCLTTPTLAAGRRRTWSAQRVQLLLQVTPREMKFDITELVGVGPGTLNDAVARLSGQRVAKADADSDVKQEGSGEDPLHTYRFDYALLYAHDRQGYWLIAATDVPCDIAPCRVAAKALPAPVSTLLREGHL